MIWDTVLIGIAHTIDFEGGLLIRIVWTIELGYCLLIGIARAIDLEGVLLHGIVRTIGIAHTIRRRFINWNCLDN